MQTAWGRCCLCLTGRAAVSRLSPQGYKHSRERVLLSGELGEGVSLRGYSSDYCLNKSYVISLTGGQEVKPGNRAQLQPVSLKACKHLAWGSSGSHLAGEGGGGSFSASDLEATLATSQKSPKSHSAYKTPCLPGFL